MSKETDTLENIVFTGNVTILSSDNPDFGPGNLECEGSIRTDIIIENTPSNGVFLEGTHFNDNHFTMTDISDPSAPNVSENRLYFDTLDSLLKSKDNSNTLTTYQPLNSRGDILSHDSNTQVRLPVGVDTQVLTVDPTQPSNLKWSYVTSGVGGTGTDPDSNKFLDLYSSTSQTLTDSYTDLILDTTRRVDDIYDITIPNEIKILNTDIYFLYVRITVNQTSSNNSSTSSMIILTDTGGGYNEIPGSKAYMFHINKDEGCNSCSVGQFLQLNNDDKLKIQIKRDNGAGILETLQHGSEIVLIRMKIDKDADSSSYFSIFNSSNININSTYSDIALNTVRIDDSIYNYSTSTGIVEFIEGGIYVIFGNISSSISSSIETNTTTILLFDTGGGYTEIPASSTFMHNNDSTDSYDTGQFCIIYTANTSDKLKIQAKIDSGAGSAVLEANGCNLNIVKLTSSLGQDTTQYFDGYNITTNTNISTNYTDIPIIVERIKDSIYIHNTNDSIVNVDEDGRYLILANIIHEKSSGTKDTQVKIRLVENTGSGYFDINGTESCSYHSNTTTGKQMSSLSCTIQLSKSTDIKLQSIIINGSNVQLYQANLTIIRLEPLDTGLDGLVPFGTELNYVESTSITSTNSETYVQKLRLTTDSIPSGTYRIGWYYIWTIDNPNTDMYSRVELDDTITIHETIERIQNSSQEIATSGFIHKSLSLGIHTVDIDFKVNDDNHEGTIKDARIEIWRLD